MTSRIARNVSSPRAGSKFRGEVTGGQARRHIDETGEHADPCGQKMQIAAGPANRHVQHERQRQIDQRRAADGSGLAPIEPRVREQNRNPAEEQHEKLTAVNQCVTRTKAACRGDRTACEVSIESRGTGATCAMESKPNTIDRQICYSLGI